MSIKRTLQAGQDPDPSSVPDSKASSFASMSLPREYKVIEFLGKGIYGSVYKCIHVPTGKVVAIKTVSDIFKDVPSAQSFVREIMLLRLFFSGHPNLVSLDHICMPTSRDTFDEVSLVFNYQDTNLEKILEKNDKLTEQHIQAIVSQILYALQYMHSLYTIHRDLKPANILTARDCSIQLCDFGMSRASHALLYVKDKAQKTEKEIEEEKRAPAELSRRLSEEVVTRWYRAPEVLMGLDYSSAIDMWALGCIFAELLMRHPGSNIPRDSRKPLFRGLGSTQSGGGFDHPQDQLRVILRQLGPPSPADLKWINNDAMRESIRKLPERKPQDFQKQFGFAGREAVSLLSRLLTFNPEKRLTAAQALNHPYLAAWVKKSNGYNEEAQRFTFPLSSIVTSNRITKKGKSLLCYYEFERRLGVMTKRAYRDLILEEIDHYQPKPSVKEHQEVRLEEEKGVLKTTVTSSCAQTSSQAPSSVSTSPSARAAHSLFPSSDPITNPPPGKNTGSISNKPPSAGVGSSV